MGEELFEGLELDGDGIFACRRSGRFDWKGRFGRFRVGMLTFQQPLHGSVIHEVQQIDETAYCRCTLRSDISPGSR